VAETAEFDAFYAATAPTLVAQLYLVTGDLCQAQDCVQEAYSRAWQRWDKICANTAHDPVAWVRSVAWRIAVSAWRRQLAHRRALRRHGAPQDVPGPSADVLAVRDALRRLPLSQRAALVLHHYEGMRVDEVAEVLGVPSGTVKARLSRGRAALAALLADHETDNQSDPRPRERRYA
jgi:RNA polymerase sigma-70 factor, ECF subfamily